MSTAGRTGLQVNSSERLTPYIYGNIAFLLSTTFFKYGSESSTGVKVKGHESCLWSERSTGAKVPWNESSWNISTGGAKVPGLQKFHGTTVLGLFAPRERKCRGTKRPDTTRRRLEAHAAYTTVAQVTHHALTHDAQCRK